jgi:hypothetical protein
MFPKWPKPIGIPTVDHPVVPGDLMMASVTSTGSPGWYRLRIENYTQGWTGDKAFVTTQFLAGATGMTAECIEEHPDFLGFPLTDFGYVTFNQCNVTGSLGFATPIWDHPNQRVDMLSGSTYLATTSPLSNDGTTFTVTRQRK